MDIITLLGLAVGFGGILVGNWIEGGSIASLMQATAALIVFGGTLGAVLVSTAREDLRMGLKLTRLGFREDPPDRSHRLVQEILQAAIIARRDTILALEKLLSGLSDPFLQRIFRMIIDGANAETLRDIITPEIEHEEDQMLAGARIWQDAGGFAPTIGIIGAVLGLISVMSHLSNTAELGKGIGVAFVATVYGVASANLLFLPLANKIKRRVKQRIATRYMVLEGAVSIVNGLSPFLIEEKMSSYIEKAKAS